jgi:hypothetical protein
MLRFPGEFVLGANLPWIDYGCDYGASAWFPQGGLGARPEAQARFERAMDRLAAGGVTIARVFLFHLCDPAREVEGVTIGGRSAFVTDEGARSPGPSCPTTACRDSLTGLPAASCGCPRVFVRMKIPFRAIPPCWEVVQR